MTNKQIYAAIEIADHEVRLVVGEFCDSRFNILRVERVRFNGIENHTIVNESNVVSAIIKAINNAANILGYQIERVLLAIPSVDVLRHSRRVNVAVRNSYGRVQISDIQRGINEAIMHQPEENLELVNIGGMKYIVNGISSRKLPLNETCESLVMDVDLFYANKKVVYSYARCIEKAGLEILDICLDSYAIAEEAAIFEQTIDSYVVLLNLARQSTTLSLFSHGKLLNCDVIYEGYGRWMSALNEKFGLKSEHAYRLMRDNATFKDENMVDRPIFIWAEKERQKELTLKQLNDTVMPLVSEWIKMVNDGCQSILDSGAMKYVLSGEGFEILGLRNMISQLNSSATIYVPQTIGGRDASLSVCLGMFYAWKTLNEIRQDSRICAQQALIDEVLSSAKQNEEEHGFTKKLKNILMSEK